MSFASDQWRCACPTTKTPTDDAAFAHEFGVFEDDLHWTLADDFTTDEIVQGLENFTESLPEI
jgi:hypothetical protein